MQAYHVRNAMHMSGKSLNLNQIWFQKIFREKRNYFSFEVFLFFFLNFIYLFIYNFFLFFISWMLITLQDFSGFCRILKWISHGFACVPHPDPHSHLPLRVKCFIGDFFLLFFWPLYVHYIIMLTKSRWWHSFIYIKIAFF